MYKNILSYHIISFHINQSSFSVEREERHQIASIPRRNRDTLSWPRSDWGQHITLLKFHRNNIVGQNSGIAANFNDSHAGKRSDGVKVGRPYCSIGE